jgi:hypothetical protein
MLPKLFHETSITQISKPDKDTIKKWIDQFIDEYSNKNS